MEANETKTNRSLLEKLKLFFVRPTELFADYLEKPTWGLKLIIISLVTAGFTYASKILGKDLVAELIEEQAASLPPDQAEAVRASIEFVNSPLMNAISAAAAMISMIVIVLLVGLVYMAFIKAMKGKINYHQVMSVYTLAYMATAIGLIAKLAFMFATGNLLFLNMKPTIMDAIYNSLDPFSIWQAILMVFGISKVAGISEKKSAIIVVSMWLVTLAISLGSVMLSR
jgi:hypothetical protein